MENLFKEAQNHHRTANCCFIEKSAFVQKSIFPFLAHLQPVQNSETKEKREKKEKERIYKKNHARFDIYLSVFRKQVFLLLEKKSA